MTTADFPTTAGAFFDTYIAPRRERAGAAAEAIAAARDRYITDTADARPATREILTEVFAS